ncbi:MAG: RNA polymerase sigma factor [Verrucomicrobiota bacterium]
MPSTPESSSVPSQNRWFAAEVHAHDSHLKAYLRGAFPSIRDVDDVVQESYLRVWRRQLVQPISSAKSFLFKIAQHLAIDTLRREKRSPLESVGDLPALRVLDHAPDAAARACTNEEIELLLNAIESLPPRCRQVFILRKLHGLSQKEIAEKLGMSERTVEVQGSLGLDRCERYLRTRGVAGRTAP